MSLITSSTRLPAAPVPISTMLVLLAPDMGEQNPIVLFHHFPQGDEFSGVRVAARRIDQTQGESGSALFDPCGEHSLHLAQLGLRRGTHPVSHGCQSQVAVPDQRDHVQEDTSLRQDIQQLSHFPRNPFSLQAAGERLDHLLHVLF